MTQKTCKIVDTCTMINLFERSGFDLGPCLQPYDVVTTDFVRKEFIRKSAAIPEMISAVDLAGWEVSELDELRSYFVNLGDGEISVMVKAVSLASEGRRVFILTDDEAAIRKFTAYFENQDVRREHPEVSRIRISRTRDLLYKFERDGKITDEVRLGILRASGLLP
jgi:hypothetical protein